MKPSASKPAVAGGLLLVLALVACSFPGLASSTAVPLTVPTLTDTPNPVAPPTQAEIPALFF